LNLYPGSRICELHQRRSARGRRMAIGDIVMTKTWVAPKLNKLGTIKDVAANNGTIVQVGNSAKS